MTDRVLPGDLKVAEAREDKDVEAYIASVTYLSARAVRARLEREHGAMLVRNAFAKEWPFTTIADELTPLNVTDARGMDVDHRLAQVTGLSVGGVRRRISGAHGRTLLVNLFEDRWPKGDDDSHPDERDDADDPEGVEAPNESNYSDRRAQFSLSDLVGDVRSSTVRKFPQILDWLTPLVGLERRTAERKLINWHGHGRVRDVFADEWPIKVTTVPREMLGTLTAASVRLSPSLGRLIADVAGIDPSEVYRKLANAQGRSRVNTVLPQILEVPRPIARANPAPARGGRGATDSPKPPRSGLPPERLFNKYDVLERLSPGGMAEVFKVREVATGEVRFLKRVLSRSQDASSLKREQQIYGKLAYADVKHVMRVQPIERDDEFIALVTDFADRSLDAHMGERQGLPLREAKRIADHLVAAIFELHGLAIVHRDIKPGNVLFHDGLWKLADFGIAKNTQVHATTTFRSAGTQGYAAPEQIEGVEARPAADVYSLGKVFAFLLTGHIDRDLVPPGAWRQLVYRCTEYSASERPSVDEVARELQRLPE